MEQDMYRITAFDDYIHGKQLSDFGDDFIVCRMYDGTTTNASNIDNPVQISAYILDAFFEEFYSNDHHLAMQFAYKLGGAIDTDMVITIDNKNTFNWTIGEEDGLLHLRIKFTLSDAAYDEQISQLRDMGNNVNIIYMCDTDSVDYGELTPEAIITCVIDPSLMWNVRTEKILISHQHNEEPVIANIISFSMGKIVVANGANVHGMVSFILVTPFHIFEKDALDHCIKETAIERTASVTLNTSDDCTLPPMPVWYDVLTDNEIGGTHDHQIELVLYQVDYKRAMDNLIFWKSVFETSSQFVKKILELYVAQKKDAIDHAHTSNTLELHRSDFEEWLNAQDTDQVIAQKFGNNIAKDSQRIAKEIQMEGFDNIFNGKFVISDTTRQYYTEFLEKAKEIQPDIADETLNGLLKTGNVAEINNYIAQKVNLNSIQTFADKTIMQLAFDNSVITEQELHDPLTIHMDNPKIRFLAIHINDILN
jgi:hypothetical protein